MNIYTAEQIRKWDEWTISQEPIASIDLMERAAQKCAGWLLSQMGQQKAFQIFCGKGNNGGDGLAIARLLAGQNISVAVYILEFGKPGTNDFQNNLQRLHDTPAAIHFLQSTENFPQIHPEDVVVDALFGSGLNKPLQGLAADLVNHLNTSGAIIVSIDLPSGLFADVSSKGIAIVKADFTLTFQTYKLAFLVPENEPFTGKVQVLDIGLLSSFSETASYKLLDKTAIQSLLQPRSRFSHKGSFGHALLIGGSYGKIGALVLSAKACLRTGVGLLTAYLPQCGYDIVQTSIPEAMAVTDADLKRITEIPGEVGRYSAIGIGPGIGTEPQTQKAVLQLLEDYKKPIVIDADALNCLSLNRESLQYLPPGSILTPHPKEFERLFGESADDFARTEKAQQKAKELQVVIVLKGHHTFIATPSGPSFFNSTGNAGMATGGSGDVLTGMITSLLAQGYSSQTAALIGVYLHGLAGDLAAEQLSMEALIAGDLISFIGPAFLHLSSKP